MASLAFMVPLLPGGAERLARLRDELHGPRAAESADFYRRMRLTAERWYVQPTPQGDIVIVYLEGEDFAHTFGALAASREPFDVWFKGQAKAIHGVDFNQPPHGPLPSLVYDSRAGASSR
jgi:hypothetical protein